MGTTSSITMQSLEKIALRARAVGAKIWCLFFCLLVTLRGRSTVRSTGACSNKHYIAVYCPISTRFSAFFFLRDWSFR